MEIVHPAELKEIELFSKEFFVKLIRLEELILSNHINQEILNDLLSSYAVKKKIKTFCIYL